MYSSALWKATTVIFFKSETSNLTLTSTQMAPNPYSKKCTLFFSFLEIFKNQFCLNRYMYFLKSCQSQLIYPVKTLRSYYGWCLSKVASREGPEREMEEGRKEGVELGLEVIRLPQVCVFKNDRHYHPLKFFFPSV